jgi:hypothetical protein
MIAWEGVSICLPGKGFQLIHPTWIGTRYNFDMEGRVFLWIAFVAEPAKWGVDSERLGE